MSYYNRYPSRSGPSAPKVTIAPDPAQMTRIDTVLANPLFPKLLDKRQDFIKSIKLQAATRYLSEAQMNYLQMVEKDLVPVNNSWWNPVIEENRQKRAYAIAHYSATGYYTAVTSKMKEIDSYMPEQSVWEKMWSNVFINAGFKRNTAGPRWNAGDIVGYRAYGAAKNGIMLTSNWSYIANNWTYDFLGFEGLQLTSRKESEFFAIKVPKPEKVVTERKPRKTKTKEA